MYRDYLFDKVQYRKLKLNHKKYTTSFKLFLSMILRIWLPSGFQLFIQYNIVNSTYPC